MTRSSSGMPYCRYVHSDENLVLPARRLRILKLRRRLGMRLVHLLLSLHVLLQGTVVDGPSLGLLC
jgi:hypothetical protein